MCDDKENNDMGKLGKKPTTFKVPIGKKRSSYLIFFFVFAKKVPIFFFFWEEGDNNTCYVDSSLYMLCRFISH